MRCSIHKVYLIADSSMGPVARSSTRELCSSDWEASAWAAAAEPLLRVLQRLMEAQALNVAEAAGLPSALLLLISCM